MPPNGPAGTTAPLTRRATGSPRGPAPAPRAGTVTGTPAAASCRAVASPTIPAPMIPTGSLTMCAPPACHRLDQITVGTEGGLGRVVVGHQPELAEQPVPG